MRRDELLSFLRGETSARQLDDHIAEEVLAWTAKLGKKGSSAALRLDGDGGEIALTREMAIRIIDNAIRGELSLGGIRYIVDILLLDSNVRWPEDEVRDVFEDLSLRGDGHALSRNYLDDLREELVKGQP